MRTSRLFVVTATAVLLLARAGASSADIIISTSQGSIQPDENLLFNQTGLTSTGNPVQGVTNTTATIFNIYSDETLTTPSGGQARVAAEDGAYSLFFLEANNPGILFTEFEANINLVARATGSATVTACNQLGSFGDSSPYAPSHTPADGGPCESLSFSVAQGENYFVLSVADSQLLRGVRIDTTSDIMLDVRQIRITPVSSSGDPLTPVPEPGSLLLLGSGLFAAARAIRRKRPSAA